MKTLHQILVQECGTNYPLKTIFDNLSETEIEMLVNKYASQFIQGESWYQLSDRELSFLLDKENTRKKLPLALQHRLVKLGVIENINELDILSKQELLLKYYTARKNNIEFKKLLKPNNQV